MEALSINSSAVINRPRLSTPPLLRRLLSNRSDFELHGVVSTKRAELESYIADCFERVYDAKVMAFAPLLLELRCLGSISGVAGIRMAGSERLFLEQYLDAPIEEVASGVAGHAVSRLEIAELGNLAALRPGACQLINVILAEVLRKSGFRYASFAGTAQLEGIVRKQGFLVHTVTPADAGRLGSAAGQWGSYYETSPNVLLVDLDKTVESLYAQRLPAALLEAYAETSQQLSDTLSALNYLSMFEANTVNDSTAH